MPVKAKKTAARAKVSKKPRKKVLLSKSRLQAVLERETLGAEALGINPQQLVGNMLTAPRTGSVKTEVPTNLPIADAPAEPEIKVYKSFSQRPLVGHRTAFWFGVGFGFFVVGVLALLTWQVLRASVVEAVVVGLTEL
ncbi:hypothetical protein HY477_02920 [Candidatus Uhrbacteria bacterium]|nr:hypothetical protein [Candidatus Uhrbacteria bacterium]